MQSKLLNNDAARKAVQILIKNYPDARYYLNFKTDVELMVAAIISARTKDQAVNALTPELFKKYKTLSDYANADEEELAKYISKVSFSEAKAKNIIKACKAIVAIHGSKIPRNMEELTELPGIGRKTANTILINAYGIVEGIPVDTWVIKLSGRIGLSKSDDPEDIEKDLMQTVDKKDWGRVAYVLKAHGKAICRSPAPICSKCMINKLCQRNGVTESK